MNKPTSPRGIYVETKTDPSGTKKRVQLTRQKDGTTFFITYDTAKKRFPKTCAKGDLYFDTECLKREKQVNVDGVMCDFYDAVDAPMRPESTFQPTDHAEKAVADSPTRVGPVYLEFDVALQVEIAALNAAVVATNTTGLEIEILWPMYADKIVANAMIREQAAKKVLKQFDEDLK